MGRKKAIPLVLKTEARNGAAKGTVVCYEEPYYGMCALGERSAGGVPHGTEVLSMIKAKFSEVVLQSKTNTKSDVVLRNWKQAVFDVLKTPDCSFGVILLKKEDRKKTDGHHLDYALSGSRVCLIFGDGTETVVDKAAFEYQSYVWTLYASAVRNYPERRKDLVERYAHYMRNEKPGCISGCFRVTEQDAKIALASIDVIRMMLDVPSALSIGVSTPEDVFEKLFENGGDNELFAKINMIKYPWLFPKEDGEPAEWVVCLLYLDLAAVAK